MQFPIFAVILLVPGRSLTSTSSTCLNISQRFLVFLTKYSSSTTTQCLKMKSLSEWSFSQPNLLTHFNIDPVRENFVRRVTGCVFSRVTPTHLKAELQLVSASQDVLKNLLDLDPHEEMNPSFSNFLAGNQLLPGSEPLAHRYGGYQFGYWAGQLGDGRAITIGEYVNSKGTRWELQLKGAGKTPYSRNGDERAVLRSSIREFLCSEAMDALGIPTSRAAAVVVSKDMVVRDQFYNGRMKYEPAAVVLRLAPTWFRIGSLEILAKEQEKLNLKQVVDFTIEHYIPTVERENYVKFFETVVEQSSALVAKWMAHGFTHGVLNTDNMSLLSITIDYGPFGFLDSYNPSFVPNHSDDEGRYSYLNQPKIFKWNLACLADALQPLLSAEEQKQTADVINRFDEIYLEQFMSIFRRKLGLSRPAKDEVGLIQLLLDIMQQRRADFTQTFRQLGDIHLDNIELSEEHWALHSVSNHGRFSEFIGVYQASLKETQTSEEERHRIMNSVNPQYVLRNWMAESAIRQAEKGDFHLTNLLLKVLRKPYEKDDEAEALGFSKPPPDWACSLRVSCSS